MSRAILLCACLVPGCLPVIPHYSLRYPTRTNVESQLDAFPVVGTTTREDVLFRFGEPDGTARRQATFRYQWTKVVAVLLAEYASDEIPSTTVLSIDFDERGVVTAVRKE